MNKSFFELFPQEIKHSCSAIELWCTYVETIIQKIEKFPHGFEFENFPILTSEQTVKYLTMIRIPAKKITNNCISIAKTEILLCLREMGR